MVYRLLGEDIVLFMGKRRRMKQLLAQSEQTIRRQWDGPGFYYAGLQAMNNPADVAFYDGSRGTPTMSALFFECEEQVLFARAMMMRTGNDSAFTVFKRSSGLEIADISVGPDADGRQRIAMMHKNGEVHSYYADEVSPDQILRYAGFTVKWLEEHVDDPNPRLEALGSLLGSHKDLTESMLSALKDMSARSAP